LTSQPLAGRDLREQGWYQALVFAALGVLLLSIVTAISFGPSDLSVGNVWDVLAHKLGFGPDPGLTPLRVATIWDLRLPRGLLAAGAGRRAGVWGGR